MLETLGKPPTMTHRLQNPKWPIGVTKRRMGSGKFTSRFLRAPVKFCTPSKRKVDDGGEGKNRGGEENYDKNSGH